MKILCYGDSNTFGHDPANKKNHKKAWPTLITKHEVTNHGANGRTLTFQPNDTRFPSAEKFIEEELTDKYDLIIIMLGTNDLKYRYHVDNKQFKDTYTYIIKKILDKYPDQKILLLPIANIYADKEEWQGCIEKRIAFNEIIEKISKDFNLDFYDYKLLDTSSDKIHLTQNGHQQLANRINKYLDSIYQ